MAFLQWDDKLDVGVDKMNDQHKRLIDIMNKLHEDNSNGAAKATLLKDATELATLAIKHFREEEQYMESIGYEGLDSHKRIHAALEKTLGEHMAAIQRPTGAFSDEFFYFLRSWLRAHIAGIDVKYGRNRSAA